MKRFVNCESIEVESNAMTQATRVDMSGLESLERIEIGDSSCNSLTEVVVGSTVFSSLSSVTIGSNSLNSITSLPSFNSIQSLAIGSNSLTSLKQLELDESMRLESASIGEGSLGGVESLVLGNSSQSRRLGDSGMSLYSGLSAFGLYSYGSGYSFSLNSQSVLRNVKQIEVKENSFSSINRFEVNGLSGLESIVVRSNSIRGVGENSAFIVEECSSLQTLVVGDGSFSEYGMITIKQNVRMTRVELGSWSFNKAWSVELSGKNG